MSTPENHLLPAPSASETGDTAKVAVGSDSLKFEELGPMVVNSDGLSLRFRIALSVLRFEIQGSSSVPCPAGSGRFSYDFSFYPTSRLAEDEIDDNSRVWGSSLTPDDSPGRDLGAGRPGGQVFSSHSSWIAVQNRHLADLLAGDHTSVDSSQLQLDEAIFGWGSTQSSTPRSDPVKAETPEGVIKDEERSVSPFQLPPPFQRENPPHLHKRLPPLPPPFPPPLPPRSGLPTNMSTLPPTFSGYSGENAEDWLTDFDCLMMVGRFAESDRLSIFKSRMRGPARSWYEALGSAQTSSWSMLTTAFEAEYAARGRSKEEVEVEWEGMRLEESDLAKPVVVKEGMETKEIRRHVWFAERLSNVGKELGVVDHTEAGKARQAWRKIPVVLRNMAVLATKPPTTLKDLVLGLTKIDVHQLDHYLLEQARIKLVETRLDEFDTRWKSLQTQARKAVASPDTSARQTLAANPNTATSGGGNRTDRSVVVFCGPFDKTQQGEAEYWRNADAHRRRYGNGPVQHWMDHPLSPGTAKAGSGEHFDCGHIHEWGRNASVCTNPKLLSEREGEFRRAVARQKTETRKQNRGAQVAAVEDVTTEGVEDTSGAYDMGGDESDEEKDSGACA
ncbi:hypothetical protein PUNSTDRAFT_137244 [Punctularia strigosozonata HHB-11173 SS5]|uniref:uncharacterized protein n=1 Tax=Punctularia strigosozonata (strain HHB-11173) TaxID=741275 RepID=UPI0004417B1C|nr:uncharacterized protein PUNSTDRAFT_137244 [Punctularia strigosozonata HHB-11173 SS5]EIN05751.1 hypothetical protein PUNSTDRAFT_137244 [Punctularia strigosozonata HHB-11173 SS5]